MLVHPRPHVMFSMFLALFHSPVNVVSQSYVSGCLRAHRGRDPEQALEVVHGGGALSVTPPDSKFSVQFLSDNHAHILSRADIGKTREIVSTFLLLERLVLVDGHELTLERHQQDTSTLHRSEHGAPTPRWSEPAIPTSLVVIAHP